MSNSKPRVLFLSYNSLIEPLGPTQIVPYVRALAQDYRMSVLSFEKAVRSREEDAAERARLKVALRADGIEWLQERYHKRPSLPATLYDIFRGVARIAVEHTQERIMLNHARGYVPGAIAWTAKRWLGIPFIFDIRGLQAEEYVDAGHWSSCGLKFWLTKRVEQWILAEADGLVSLTEASRPILRGFAGLRQRPALPPWAVIPCCVDLDRFRFRVAGREQVRAELGLGDRPVLVYAGSIGTWYLLEEMLQFYTVAKRTWPELFLLVLCNGSTEGIREALQRHGIADRDSVCRWVPAEQMPDYLSAADAGMAFIRPCLSKRSSSPTKFAEYLACGLPIVTNDGIGDVRALMQEESAGVLVERFDQEAYVRAGRQLREQLARGREPFRRIAERIFSLTARGAPAYRRLYAEVFARRPKKRVLFLTPYPLHCAPSQRLKFEQYYGDFEAQGVQVTVSPFISPALWRVLYERGHLVTKGLWTLYGYGRRVRDFLRARRFDAVYVHLWATPFGPPWFEEALAQRGAALIYDIDDLIYLPRASRANAFMSRFRKEERIARIMRVARHVIVCTEHLRRFALRHNTTVTCISSTIDTLVYAPRRHSTLTRGITIGWSGSHSTAPYLQLLAPVLQLLSKRFDLRVLVIGDARFRMDGVRVEARPWILERETSDLAEMDLGVYPLPNEEWVLGKSGLKALQYMGMGIPVVASAIGEASEFIRDGENGFLARTPEEWLQRLTCLIEDPQRRALMGTAGRMTVEQQFSVKVTAPAYRRILHSVFEGISPQGPSTAAPSSKPPVDLLRQEVALQP